MSGFFGWTGTPAAFHVVTLALQWELNEMLFGDCLVYVDDIIVATLVSHLSSDKALTKGLCTGLLGPKAVEDAKDEEGRRVETIGYMLDLNRQLVTLGERCWERAFYGFLSIDLDSKVSRATLECLASWASRYAEICPLMAPFIRALYNAYKGRDRHSVFSIPSNAQCSIRMMQMLLMLVVADEDRFARSMVSFLPLGRLARLVGIFDASLTGIGICFYTTSKDGVLRLVGVTSKDIRALESAWQNCAEFTAGVCTVRGFKVLLDHGLTVDGERPNEIELRGDSMSALLWVRKSRFRSCLVANAARVYVL
jgi:hypothetical protein